MITAITEKITIIRLVTNYCEKNDMVASCVNWSYPILLVIHSE